MGITASTQHELARKTVGAPEWPARGTRLVIMLKSNHATELSATAGVSGELEGMRLGLPAQPARKSRRARISRGHWSATGLDDNGTECLSLEIRKRMYVAGFFPKGGATGLSESE